MLVFVGLLWEACGDASRAREIMRMRRRKRKSERERERWRDGGSESEYGSERRAKTEGKAPRLRRCHHGHHQAAHNSPQGFAGQTLSAVASMVPWKQATSILTRHASARADWAPSCKAWVFRNAASSRAPGLGFRWDRGKIAVMSNQRSVDPLAGDEGRGSKDDLPHPLLACLLLLLIAGLSGRWACCWAGAAAAVLAGGNLEV